MATLRSIGPFRHLRALPSQYVLHYRGGKLVRNGPGLSYWFNPLSAAIAEVPVEDCETTFLIKERTRDFQEVNVQCTVRYRFADPQKAASRVNFSISVETGAWVEKPLQRLDSLLAGRATQPARAWLAQSEVREAMQGGPAALREAIFSQLATDAPLTEMGVAVAWVQVGRVSPAAELERAIEAPTREGIQQKADEAVFQRRALAVEKERAIKENELATQIELARRQEDLIKREGANALMNVQQGAEAEKAKVKASAERRAMESEAYASEVRTKAAADADAKRSIAAVEGEAERLKLDAWRSMPPSIAYALAFRSAADKLPNIKSLTITPDLLTRALDRVAGDKADEQ